MRQPRSVGVTPLSGFVVLLAATALAACVAGCGGATSARPAGVGESAASGVSSRTCTGEQSEGSPEVTYCEFVLQDGQRFKCRGRRFEGSEPSASELSSKACVPLSRVAIPVVPRAVLTAIARARTCLTSHGLEVTGGPVGPEGPGPWSSPYGVLDVASVVNVPSYTAVIAFERNVHRAKPRKGHVIRVGAGEERRGAVTVVWRVTPTTALRRTVRACAFG